MELVASSGEGFAYSHEGNIWYTSPSEDAMSIKVLNGLLLNKEFSYFHGLHRYNFTDYLVFTSLNNIIKTRPRKTAPQLNELINLIGENVAYKIKPHPLEVCDGHSENWGTYNNKLYCFDPIYSKTISSYYTGYLDLTNIIYKYGIHHVLND